MGPGNKPLDLDWLEDFIALCATGNFSRAAEARAIAQPALSRHIRSLEEWAGVDLIDRTAHPVELTPAGKKFKPLLESVLADLEAARIKARAAHGQASASLRFASTHSLSLTFFPRWLSSLEASQRLGPVQTMSDSFQACEDLMSQRRVQFLLCYGHAAVPSRLDEGQYPVANLGVDRLIPVSARAPSGEPFYSLDAPDLLPILEYSDASGLGRIVRAVLRDLNPDGAASRHAASMSVVFTAHNAFLLKTMALNGKGLAWLPQSLISEELHENRLCIAGADRWQIPIDIRLYRQKSEMSQAAEEIWRVITAQS